MVSRTDHPESDEGYPPSSRSSQVREITIEALVNGSKLTVGKTENLEHYLKRVTHLNLNGSEKKVIKKIQNLHFCPNLKVLYLYDNEIETIEGLDNVPLLTHLHLQNNCIDEMKNLDHLRGLEKLYMEGNRLSRLEGLENSSILQELHLSNQCLPHGRIFSFEDRTMHALERSLRILNLANCKVASTRSLWTLRSLQQLDLSKNLISELDDVFGLLGSLSSLVELNLLQNPVTNQSKYREKTITFSSSRLVVLDQKDIDANQRRMMQTHLAHKYKKRQESDDNQTHPTHGTDGDRSTVEYIRKLKHGSMVHQRRSMPLTSNKSNVGQFQSDGDTLGVAGSTCSISTALVRSSQGRTKQT